MKNGKVTKADARTMYDTVTKKLDGKNFKKVTDTEWAKVFKEIDTSGNGTVDAAELKEAAAHAQAAGYKLAEIETETEKKAAVNEASTKAWMAKNGFGKDGVIKGAARAKLSHFL